MNQPVSTTFTTERIFSASGKAIAIEYHVTRYTDPVCAKYAEAATKRNAELAAARFGSCAAVTGYGYCVSTSPLPECTC
jgi:hypothetical protein